MKKILALMLTVMMLLTSVSLTAVAADPLTPAEWYAGLNTATLKFAENVTTDNAPTVAVTTSAGAAVEATATYKSNIMTLTFAQKLALDTDYLITINGNTEKFKVKKVWEPTFSGNETDGYDVSGIKFGVYNANIGYYYVPSDTELIVGSDGGSSVVLIPDIDTKNEDYKNASLSFDVKYPNDWGCASSHAGFNLQSDDGRFMIHDYNLGYDAFFWLANSEIYTPRRAYKIGSLSDDTLTKGVTGFNTNSSNANSSELSTDVEYTLSGYYGDEYDVKLTGSGETTKNTVYKAASVTLGSKVSEMKPYSWTVDKMGATANLVINNTFVDTYIPQEYYTSSGATGTAPEYGYFAFGTTREEKIFSNIMLTKMEKGTYASGTLTASFEAAGNKVTITFAGAANIDLSNVNTEDYVSFTDNLSYNVLSKEGNKVVIEALNPEYKTYTLTVAEGFGYDALTVKEGQTFDITFEDPNANALTPVKLYAGARTITAEYEEAVTEADLGEIALTTIEGAAVPFTTKINKEFLTIIAEEEFTRDTQEYIIKLGNTRKVFKIKTLFTPKFVPDTVNNTVTDLHIGGSQGSTVDVVDKDTLILSTTYDNFVLDYDEITNYENATLVADVYYASPNTTGTHSVLAYNVTSKDDEYTYGDKNGAKAVSRAVWLRQGLWVYTEGDRYFDRMVAITGSNPFTYKGFAKADAIAPISALEDRNSDAVKRALSDGLYGTAYTEGKTTVGTTQLPTDFNRANNKYRFVIDKMGAVGTLMMNDTFIDIMDSQDYYDEYNAANGTDLKAPTKGYFAINPISSAGKYRIIVSNMALITSEMRDYEAVEITDVTFNNAAGESLESIQNATAVKGAVTVWNRFPITKNIKLVAVAYSGNKMIDVAILDINNIDSNKKETRDYSFTNLEGLTHIKVLAWEDFGTMYPYCKAFENNK